MLVLFSKVLNSLGTVLVMDLTVVCKILYHTSLISVQQILQQVLHPLYFLLAFLIGGATNILVHKSFVQQS